MKFSLIIPTKDRRSIINKSLAHLDKVVNKDDIEIIIVNDFCEDLVVEDFKLRVRIVKNKASGVASARNYGASLAENEWLIFMDDDMWVQPDTFVKLLPLLKDREERCLNINWIYPPELVSLRSGSPFLRYLNKYGFDSLQGWSNLSYWQSDEIFEVDGITSQFFVINRNLFNRFGGYNEKFPFAGFEDHDLGKRLKSMGITIVLDPKNLIFHNEEDRIEIEKWLERKWRGAYTRKVATTIGYDDLRLCYPFVKRLTHKLFFASKGPLLLLLERWNFSPKMDSFYFFLVNRLFGAYVFDGYSQDLKQSN